MIYRHTHRMYSSGIFILYPYRTVNLLRLASDLFVTSTLVVIKMNVFLFEPSVFYSLLSLPQLLPHLLRLSLCLFLYSPHLCTVLHYFVRSIVKLMTLQCTDNHFHCIDHSFFIHIHSFVGKVISLLCPFCATLS